MNLSLAKNSLWMVLSRFVAQGLAVVFTILLARKLGSTGFGEYAFIAALLFVTNALTTFGTDMLLIREIAAKDDLSGLPMALVIQLVLSCIFILLAWLLGAQIPNQSAETVLALKVYSLTLIPLAFFTVFTIALRGKQLMGEYAWLNVIVATLQILAVLSLRENRLVTLSSILLSTQIFAALAAGLFCTFRIPSFWQAWHLSSFPLFSFLKAAAPIALLTLLAMLYQRLSVTMLSLMTDPAQTGNFSAAARVIEASKTAHLAVFAALYPAMAQGTFPQRGRARSMLYLVGGACLISFGLFIFAGPLVSLLYGSEFAASVVLLKILTWSLIPFTLNTYLTLSLLAAKREAVIARALTMSLLGMLILNLWWIPTLGPVGSAWAGLLAECVQSIILLVSVASRNLTQGALNELSEFSRET